jgi:hypothetical protein
VLASPGRWWPWLPERWARTLASRWISAASGCDSSLTVVDVAAAEVSSG